MKTLIALFLLFALPMFGAVPAYTSFRGTGGILITSNPPTGNITFDGAGIFTSSGTNSTIAVSSNGVLVMVAATNINFITGSNVFLAATNIGSSAHIGINAFTPVPFIEGAVTNLLLTWILPILTVDSLTVSNLLAAPPLSSVQYNSNGITRGSAGFIYTNGQVRVADIVVAGQGVEITAGSLVFNGGATALAAWNNLGNMRWPSSGVVRFEDQFSLNMNRIQLGGDTAAFPAIGRTNGDIIILGANGNFKLGGATNRLIAPAVHIANDGAPGTTLLSLDNPLSSIRWDMAIDAHPETYFLSLGRVGDATPTMVWELGGNVGIGITNPTVRLDVQGRFMARSNVYFPNISSNALPVAFLATDSDGQVYETAVPSGGGGTPGGNSAAIQFNQSGAFAGTNTLVFDRTNNRVGIGIASPLYTLDVQASTGIERIVSTTAANEALVLFVNNGAGLIGLESSVAGTSVAGSSAYSLLVANQYAYPVQLATDNAVRMTVLPTSGNVGISTVSPTNTLDVNGHTSLRSNVFLADLTGTGHMLAATPAGLLFRTNDTSGAGGGGAGSFAVNPNQFVTNSQLNIRDGALTTNLVVAGVGYIDGLITAGGTNVASFLGSNYFGGLIQIASGSPGTGQVLTSDANGNATWEPATGSTTPAPPISSVQFNSNGVMQGSSGFIFTNSNVGIGTASPTFRLGITTAGDTYGMAVGQGGSASGKILAVGYFLTGDYGIIESLHQGTGYKNLAISPNGGNVGIGTNAPLVKLDVAGGIRSHTVTASRMAAFHSDKTLTNGATTVALLDNFFAMGITNITNFGSGIVIGTNGGTLTISNSAAGSGAFAAGNSNQIPFLNPAGTGYMYAGYLSVTNPGFGFSPSGPHGGYGGLMVFGNSPMGLLTIGHPNAGSDFTTFATALVVSNRYNGAGDFKNDMIKIDAVLVGGSTLQADSTMTRWRVWNGTTSSNDVAEITVKGQMNLYNGTLYRSNSIVSVLPTAAELGVGGFWTGNSNNAALVCIYSLNGSTTVMKVLAP